MEILNVKEEEALKEFISSPYLVEAVKKFLLNDIYGAGVINKDEPSNPRKNWVYGIMMNSTGQDLKINNEEIGEKVRAIVEGTRALELAFTEMEKLNVKEVEPEKEEPNPGS